MKVYSEFTLYAHFVLLMHLFRVGIIRGQVEIIKTQRNNHIESQSVNN